MPDAERLLRIYAALPSNARQPLVDLLDALTASHHGTFESGETKGFVDSISHGGPSSCLRQDPTKPPCPSNVIALLLVEG